MAFEELKTIQPINKDLPREPPADFSSEKEKKKTKKPARPKDFMEKKKQAEQVLAFSGTPYDEWLHQKHLEVIEEKLPIILENLAKNKT